MRRLDGQTEMVNEDCDVIMLCAIKKYWNIFGYSDGVHECANRNELGSTVFYNSSTQQVTAHSNKKVNIFYTYILFTSADMTANKSDQQF